MDNLQLTHNIPKSYLFLDYDFMKCLKNKFEVT